VIVLACYKSRTNLGNVREFTVTDDASLRVLGGQILQQVEHGFLLGIGASIGNAAFSIDTALIADTEGTAVVVAGMSPTDVLGENGYYLAIHTDIIMIGGLAEAGIARGDEGFDTERSSNLSGAAVNDEEFHCIVVKMNQLWHKQ
jgi:hypothetical protein